MKSFKIKVSDGEQYELNRKHGEKLESSHSRFGISSNNDSQNEWMNTTEAAAFLKVTVRALWRLTGSGSVPFYKLNRNNRYLKSDLERLLLSTRRGKQ